MILKYRVSKLNKIIIYFTSNKHILKIFLIISVKLENEHKFIISLILISKILLPKYEVLNQENLFISDRISR